MRRLELVARGATTARMQQTHRRDGGATRGLIQAGSSLALALAAGCGSVQDAGPGGFSEAAHAPPETRAERVADDYHGVLIEDPYRWLEDQDSTEVLAWADRQNAWTEAHLSRSANRDAIRSRLLELWDRPRYGLPIERGGRWFFSKNDGLQNQPVVFVADAPEADGQVLLDPNGLSTDGTVALSDWVPSHDGARLAFATSASGSDWRSWSVLDVATGAVLEDRLEWSKFSSVAWTHDGLGFFYQRYPEPASGEVFEASNENPQLCYHRVGSAQSEDRVVYERPDQPQWGFATDVTEDGRFAMISIWAGTDSRNRVAMIDLQDAAATVKPVLMDFDASYSFVGNRGAQLFFLTDNAAPRGRIISVEAAAPDPEQWLEVLPEGGRKIESVTMLGGQLVVRFLDDARHVLERFSLEGEALGEVPLPGIGSVSGVAGRDGSSKMFYSFESFVRPRSVLAYDLSGDGAAQKAGTELRQAVKLDSAGGFDPARFVTRQVAFQGRDGTRLLMFLVHKRGLRLDSSHPTYLYGYGGFNISLTPRFSVPNLVWVERGGVYAQATLRGGGEFGEDWHQGGMLADKQNVFDDFVDCAEYLLRNDYTSTQKLAIGGRSNGGLLVGATLNQRPELFGAAIPEVGVLDMLRYHKFTIGWAWASEYGRSDDPEMFEALRAYSPLHNVRPATGEGGVQYPPTMVMTGDHDDRVLPGHSYKFAAALQKAQPDAPILLRVQRAAGHGAGKPVRMQVEEAADRWAFLDWALR